MAFRKHQVLLLLLGLAAVTARASAAYAGSQGELDGVEVEEYAEAPEQQEDLIPAASPLEAVLNKAVLIPAAIAALVLAVAGGGGVYYAKYLKPTFKDIEDKDLEGNLKEFLESGKPITVRLDKGAVSATVKVVKHPGKVYKELADAEKNELLQGLAEVVRAGLAKGAGYDEKPEVLKKGEKEVFSYHVKVVEFKEKEKKKD